MDDKLQEFVFCFKPSNSSRKYWHLSISGQVTKLPPGTIERITGKKLTWADEPLEWWNGKEREEPQVYALNKFLTDQPDEAKKIAASISALNDVEPQPAPQDLRDQSIEEYIKQGMEKYSYELNPAPQDLRERAKDAKTATSILYEHSINIMSMDDTFNSQLLTAMERYAEHYASEVSEEKDREIAELKAMNNRLADDDNERYNQACLLTEKEQRIAELESIYKKLELFGGAIVCTASLSVDEIAAAKDEGRMYVDKHGIGYAWIPKDLILSWAVNDNQK